MSELETIKQLREKTGAGMMDCQNALEEAEGDTDKAVEILRKKGLEKADKRSGRETHQGLIALAKEGDKVAVVVLRCETDFVALNEDFIKAVNEFAQKLLTISEAEFRPWVEEKIAKELTIKIGENIQLGEFGLFAGETIGVYLHSDKRQAAVAVLSGNNEELADNLAMQVVAMSPDYLNPEDVPAEVLDKEKEVYREQTRNEGKPDDVIEKIIAGKLNKFYSEVCLLKQPYIKDDKVTIEKFLGDIKVIEFKRYSV